jgi:hypothetical protein
MDGIPPPPKHPHPFREFARELRSVVPPFTILHLWMEKAGGGAIAVNLAAAAAFAALAWLASVLLGTPVQWIALAAGLYAAFSWVQALKLRDRPTFALVFHTPALRWACVGFAFLAFTGYGTGFWAPPFLIRLHGATESQVGLVVGPLSAVGGWLGVTIGGLLADRLRKRSINGRLQVGLITAILPLPLAYWMFTTPSLTTASLLIFPLTLSTSLWLGPGASTVQDLVLPRMRATASAAYLLVVTFIGLAMGPYAIGRLSVALEDLRAAILWSLCANVVAAVFLLVAMRHLERDQACVIKRAREVGEGGLGQPGASARDASAGAN